MKHDFIPLLSQLTPEQKGNWGLMNAQQMVEHFSDTTRMANGRLVIPLHTPAESLSKLRAYLLSQRPFKENTKNPTLSDKPAECKHNNMKDAADELMAELNYFFEVFEKNPGLTTLNNVFGDLNFEENIHLLYKHALHHLKQFGIIV